MTAIKTAHILEKHQVLAVRAMEGFHGRSDSTEISSGVGSLERGAYARSLLIPTHQRAST
jgi:hypothetical protein